MTLFEEILDDLGLDIESEIKNHDAKEREKFIREWYQDSPSGSVLGAFENGNYETIIAIKK